MPITFNSWCELVSGQRDTISVDNKTPTIPVAVPGSIINDFLQFTLPTSAVEHATPNDIRLRRHVPVQWPLNSIGTAYAKRVTLSGFGANEPTRTLPDGTVVPGTAKAPVGIGDNTPPVYVYAWYSGSVEFESVDFDYVDDEAIDNQAFIDPDTTDPGFKAQTFRPEWKRNCVIRPLVNAEQLTLDGSFLQFVENPDPPKPQNIKGTPFDARFAITERKAVISVLWKNVPAGFVLTNNLFPRQFCLGLGKVNKFEFLGCPAETLALFDMPEFMIKPIGLRDIRFTYQFPWQYDILIKFRYFNPPTDGQLGKRGWNLFPPRGHNGKYLYCTRRPWNSPATYNPDNSDPAAPPAFPVFNMQRLFQHATYCTP